MIFQHCEASQSQWDPLLSKSESNFYDLLASSTYFLFQCTCFLLDKLLINVCDFCMRIEYVQEGRSKSQIHRLHRLHRLGIFSKIADHQSVFYFLRKHRLKCNKTQTGRVLLLLNGNSQLYLCEFKTKQNKTKQNKKNRLKKLDFESFLRKETACM